jgi:hypothetical protein
MCRCDVFPRVDAIDAEWLDICDAVARSGLVTWQDWIDLGIPEL